MIRVARVAAVDAPGQIAVGGLVLGQVAVEEVDDDPADADPPGPEPDLAAADRHDSDDGVALGVQHGLQGQVLRVERGVGFDLPVLVVERLHEIAFAIEQADSDEPEPQIAGRLGMVGRKDAQSARSDGQGFVEAELGAEVGHRPLQEVGRVLATPGLVLVEVSVEGGQNLTNAGGEGGVEQSDLELVSRDFVQDGDRIVVEVLPGPRREVLEQLLGRRVPGPPQVPGQAVQPRRQDLDLAVSVARLRHTDLAYDRPGIKRPGHNSPIRGLIQGGVPWRGNL